jgi:mannan endo-1,4-beta-mannosidase
MTSPPPAAPRPGRHAQPGRASRVTRIVQTDELPDGVNALASADGKTIIVRASLDRFSRRRAMHEVMATIRRFPRLALYPAMTAEGIRQVFRRISEAVASASQATTQVTSLAADHLGSVAVAVTAVAGTAVVIVAVTVASPSTPAAPGQAPAAGGPAGSLVSGPAPVHVTLPTRPLSYLGVYESGVPGSYAPVDQFAAATGHQPDVALYYSGWYERFQAGFAEEAYVSGATPFVQIEPYGVSLAAIAAGDYDGYLISYADAVREYGHAVIIGFAHEPNSATYPWGLGHTDPADFIAAWRHVVDVFRAQGADNVTWLWTVNSVGAGGAGPVAPWWPGQGYVTWVGIDGYFVLPTSTFANVVGSTLAAVRQLTGDPVLISETAVGPGTGDQAGKIAEEFSGVRADGLLGLVWFDVDQQGGIYHQDWRLEGDQAAVTAFRKGAGYLAGS